MNNRQDDVRWVDKLTPKQLVAWRWLRRVYPGLFDARDEDGHHVYRPMAIGVGKVLLGLHLPSGTSKTALREVLMLRTRHGAYLFQLQRREAMRYDLKGQPVELVSEAHGNEARNLMAQRRDAKRAAAAAAMPRWEPPPPPPPRPEPTVVVVKRRSRVAA
jgi:sRNA-binding protein